MCFSMAHGSYGYPSPAHCLSQESCVRKLMKPYLSWRCTMALHHGRDVSTVGSSVPSLAQFFGCFISTKVWRYFTILWFQGRYIPLWYICHPNIGWSLQQTERANGGLSYLAAAPDIALVLEVNGKVHEVKPVKRLQSDVSLSLFVASRC